MLCFSKIISIFASDLNLSLPTHVTGNSVAHPSPMF